MTKLLDRAISKLKTLPPSDQDALALIILAELEDEFLSKRSPADFPETLVTFEPSAMDEYCTCLTQKIRS